MNDPGFTDDVYERLSRMCTTIPVLAGDEVPEDELTGPLGFVSAGRMAIVVDAEAGRQRLRVPAPALEPGVGTENDSIPQVSRMQADLLVIDGQPDQRIRDLRAIQVVMKGGAIFRSDLASLPAAGLAMPGVELANGTFAKVY